MAAQGCKVVKRRAFRLLFLIDKGNCTTVLARCAASSGSYPSPASVNEPIQDISQVAITMVYRYHLRLEEVIGKGVIVFG